MGIEKKKKILNNFKPFRLSELWNEDKKHKTIKVISDANLALDEYQLSEVGSSIWQLCDGKHFVEEIARKLKSQCKGNIPLFPVIYKDVVNYLEQLKKIGLISWFDDEPVDVLFVVPPFPSPYSLKAIKTPEYSAPPLGICYIAAVLREHGFNVAIFDMHQNVCLPEEIIAECRRRKPKIVGITSTTPTYFNAKRISRFVKALDDKIITVLGGAHATGLPDECVKSGAFDYVCIGEGEQSILELTKALLHGSADPHKIPGIAYLSSNGDMLYTGLRERLSDLDTLPYPARDLIDINSYYQKGSIVSSRGCPFNCNYCACAAIAGKSYRVHSIDYVLNEIEHVMNNYGCTFFDFHDDTFNLNEKRVFDFCNAIKERKMKFGWGCFCRAAQFSSQMAQAMATAGCKVIQFGVESGSQKILNSIKKRTTLKQIEDAVRAASRANIEQIVCGFIMGHANDTETTIGDTIKFGLHLSRLGVTRLTLSLLTPYPGTEVYEKMDELGIKLLTTDWEKYIFSRVVIETNYLQKDKLRELYVKGISKFLEVTKK